MYSKNLLLDFIIVFVVVLLLVGSTPHKAPAGEFFVVKEGASVSSVIYDLQQKGYIHSPVFMRAVLPAVSGGESVKAGTYFFEPKQTIFGMINQLVTADYGVESIKVTLPEGLNVFQAALILKDTLPSIDGARFLELAEGSEGYLYPDTYLFSPNDSEQQVYQKLLDTFSEKTKQIFTDAGIIEDPEKIYDTLKLASIIEEEAKNSKDRRLISGVLHNRLEIGMALQVDVTFQYINGKNTYELTAEDLKDTSPYNTYTHTGLPPTPISNPGLDSIDAALNPVRTDYFYFLADRNGTTYFSETFEEHVRKKRKYL